MPRQRPAFIPGNSPYKLRYLKIPAICIQLFQSPTRIEFIDETFSIQEDRRPGFIYVDPSFELSSDKLDAAISVINRRISHYETSSLSDEILSYYITDTFSRYSIPVSVSMPRQPEDIITSFAQSRPPRFRKMISRRNKSAKKPQLPDIFEPKIDLSSLIPDSSPDSLPQISVGDVGPFTFDKTNDQHTIAFLNSVRSVASTDDKQLIESAEWKLSRRAFNMLSNNKLVKFEWSEKLHRYYTEDDKTVLWVTIVE